jgi:hypothetical protein
MADPGVDRADPARMAGAPGFEQIQGLGAADFAHRNAIGPQPQRRAHQVGERGDAVPGAQRDQVRRLALQLADILDQNDPLGGLGHLGEECVDEGRLAGRRAAGDQNIVSLRNGIAEGSRRLGRHDPRGSVVIESEDRDRRLPDGKGRRRDDRRDQAFEALTGFRQLGRDPGRTGMYLCPDMVGDETHDPLAIGR